MASGLPARVTLLTYEAAHHMVDMVIAGKAHRDLLPVAEEVKALAKQADNGVAAGFVDIRGGLDSEEMMTRQLERQARQLRQRRRAAAREQRGTA